MAHQYQNTPTLDFYLDIWKPLDITSSKDDRTYIIETKYHERPDLLAFELYGTTELFWVFWQFNKDAIEDPIHDFVSGLEIKIPARNSIGGQ